MVENDERAYRAETSGSPSKIGTRLKPTPPKTVVPDKPQKPHILHPVGTSSAVEVTGELFEECSARALRDKKRRDEAGVARVGPNPSSATVASPSCGLGRAGTVLPLDEGGRFVLSSRLGDGGGGQKPAQRASDSRTASSLPSAPPRPREARRGAMVDQNYPRQERRVRRRRRPVGSRE